MTCRAGCSRCGCSTTSSDFAKLRTMNSREKFYIAVGLTYTFFAVLWCSIIYVTIHFIVKFW